MTYQDYIHQKLKKMALLERVQTESKQIQLVQRINYENLIKEKNRTDRDIQLVQRISYNLEEMNTGKQELMEATLANLAEIEKEKTFSREELYEAISHMPDDPNKRRTGQEMMMAAIYGEDSLPNGKDILQT